jgi:AraC-like DNA-binding protein
MDPGTVHGPLELVERVKRALESQVEAVASGASTVRLPAPHRVPERFFRQHAHSFPELFVQLSGFTRFTFGQEQLRVSPGEICIVPRGMPHAEVVGPLRGPFENLVFMNSQKLLAFHLAKDNGRGHPAIALAGNVECVNAPRLAQYLDDVAEIASLVGPSRDAAIRGLIVSHLASVLLLLDGQSAAPQRESLKVSEARRIVRDRLADPALSVRAIARTIGCSADYLSWLFHRETKTPLNVFINEQRLILARHKLTESTLNISEIAVLAGFADAGYFARVFRRATGQTPGEYRRTVRRVSPLLFE